jgi:hypothetical protein
MFIGTEPAPDRTLSRTKAVLVSLVMVGIAAALFVVGAVVGPQPEWLTPAIYGIASAAIGVGAVSLIYDLWLRHSVEHELLRLVKIEKSLAKAGIVGAGEARHVDWGWFLDSAYEINVLMADPEGWISRNWAGLIAGGVNKRLELRLYFPDPESPALPTLAAHLGSPEEDFRKRLVRAADLAEDSWKAASREGQLASASSLHIYWVSEFPSYSLIRADDYTVVLIHRSTGRPPTDQGFVFVIMTREDSGGHRWIEESWSRATLRTKYVNEVSEGDEE